ncbi:hypothetical protein BGW38_000239 [Lunasporangiospora selenospora]|uniref:Kelch motif-containing protein n=1 Tax=Lunasporangiospora selenospora TaxID=979761 RepID=A0A9P6G2Z6_9FUNG|nr:hypothetical protein BGW38_000239 [Lunasporangiospora selenospora]
MSTLPSLVSSCIAPDRSGQNAYLFGAPAPGRLEAHLIDLSNPLSPTSRLVSTLATSSMVGLNPAPAEWDPKYNIGCYSYMGGNPPPDSPINIVQFENTAQVLFYPNGTWQWDIRPTNTNTTTPPASVDYLSPKLFNLVGSTNGQNWYLAKTRPRGNNGADGTWRDFRIGDHKMESGSREPKALGSESPLLTVGAIAQDLPNFGNGYMIAFDQSGLSGTAYRTFGNKFPGANITHNDALVNVTRISSVDMGGNTLTAEAIPVTSAFSAAILDKGLLGTISLLSIDPRSSPLRLQMSAVGELSPKFLPGQSVAALNSKVVVYGGRDDKGPTNQIHMYDVISGSWSGPVLIDPKGSNSQETAGGINPAIIGGIAGAVVVILLVVGLLIMRRRRQRRARPISTDSQLNALGGMLDGKESLIKLQDLEKGDEKPQSRPNARKNESMDSNMTAVYSSTSGTGSSNRTLNENRIQSNPEQPRTQTQPIQHQRQPTSSSRHHRSQRSSRTASASAFSLHSLHSDVTDSHLSYYSTAPSNVYILNSPTALTPPTPMVPAAYALYTQNLYPTAIPVALAPNNIPRADGHSPNSRSNSIYKVAVPDDYDDRQPLHRRNASGEPVLSYSPAASGGSPESSPSLSGTWSVQSIEKPQPIADIRTSRRQNPLTSGGSNSVGHGREIAGTTDGETNTGSRESGRIKHQGNERSSSHRPSASVPKPRKKKPNQDARRAKTMSVATMKSVTSVDEALTFKVEYKGPISRIPSVSVPTSRPVASTAMSPTAGPTPTSPVSPSEPYRDSIMSSTSSRQQLLLLQQHQQQLWRQQQQQQQQEQQPLAQEPEEAYSIQGAKTPKLASLPRPIPRENKNQN